MKEKLRNYLFGCIEEGSDCEGEEFFVQEKSLDAAHLIAEQYFGAVQFLGIYTDEEAEMMGLDTY